MLDHKKVQEGLTGVSRTALISDVVGLHRKGQHYLRCAKTPMTPSLSSPSSLAMGHTC